MKALIIFWKKDIINKLIAIISAALIVGAVVIVYLLLNMKSDSMFYAVFPPALGSDSIPTLAAVTTGVVSETPFIFPTSTSFPVTPVNELLTPTLEQSSATVTGNPTVIPESASPTLAQSTPTATLAVPTEMPVSSEPAQSSSQAAVCIPANPPQTGKVLDVIDGNTVRVLIDGAAFTVRYIGIDVPRYKPTPEYFGQEADFKNAEFVFAKQVTLISDVQDKDDSGRLLRYVKVGEVFVNYELVRLGYASANTASSSCAQAFQAAELSASQNLVGKWNPTPTIPSPE